MYAYFPAHYVYLLTLLIILNFGINLKLYYEKNVVKSAFLCVGERQEPIDMWKPEYATYLRP